MTRGPRAGVVVPHTGGAGMAVDTDTSSAVAVEVLGHSFTPSLPAAISSRWAGKTPSERAARGRGRGAHSVLTLQPSHDILRLLMRFFFVCVCVLSVYF